MYENPKRGRQARNFTAKLNVPKILDLKSASEQILFSKNWRCVPLNRMDALASIPNDPKRLANK